MIITQAIELKMYQLISEIFVICHLRVNMDIFDLDYWKPTLENKDKYFKSYREKSHHQGEIY